MSYVKDSRVDHYIDALPEWQQAICQEVRDLAHAADPEVVETIKRTVQPYFVLDGPKMSHDQLAGKSTGRPIPRGFDQLTDFI